MLFVGLRVLSLVGGWPGRARFSRNVRHRHFAALGMAVFFRNTTYRPSDYAKPTGEFGVPMHHPRFLEWIGVPESASLLEMEPGM